MAIRIITKKDGFWRAGIKHIGTQIYSAGKFTAEQLKLLRAEPLLIVEEIPDPPPVGDGEDQPDKPLSKKAAK